MLNKMFWGFLALFFPWLVLLLHDNPGGAIVALVMQATLFGWLPATLWAMRTLKEKQEPKIKKRKSR